MTEPASGVPELESVAADLLDQLRAAAGIDLEYVAPVAPVTGGYETFTYGFEVSADSGPFAGPLILRVFRENGSGNQGRREAAFQNALAGLGYPVPRVVLQVGSPGIDGRPFNVMERVRGQMMLQEAFAGTSDFESILQRLAAVQSRLHGIPAAPVITAIEESGFSVEAFSIWHRVDSLSRYFDEPEFENLRPVWDWLRDHRPYERDTPAVCHGDLHPGNIMTEDGQITGVIDWPGASFADAEYDVAVTLVLFVVAGGLFTDIRGVLPGFRGPYLAAYEKIRALDHERLDYYEAMRSFVGFIRGTAATTPGVNPDLLPRDGYPWANAWVMQQGAARLEEITGLPAPLPAAFTT